MRDAAINLRALKEERDLIDYAARLMGKNRSDFMLEVACERAKSIMLDQVFFRLDKNKFRLFKKLIDEAQSENQSLEKLMLVKAPWKKSQE